MSRKNKIARSDAPLNPKSFSQEMTLETTWNNRLTTGLGGNKKPARVMPLRSAKKLSEQFSTSFKHEKIPKALYLLIHVLFREKKGWARGSVRLERRTLKRLSTYRDIRKDIQFDCCLGKVAGSIPVGPARTLSTIGGFI